MQVQYVARQKPPYPYYLPENGCYTPREKEFFQVENIQQDSPRIIDQQPRNQVPNLQAEVVYTQQSPTFIQQNIETQPVYIEIPQYFTQQPIQQIPQQETHHNTRDATQMHQQGTNQNTRDLSQIVTTVGDAMIEEKINQLKEQVADLEKQLTIMIEKKIRKCFFI
jgi:hypothetical protein